MAAGIILKNSNNGQYTGMIRGYTIGEDSIMIQYSVYNSAYQLIKNVPLLLPHKPDFIDLNNSLIDNFGNLFFYTIQNVKDSVRQQRITLYKLNIIKDSLLTNIILRNGIFSKVVLQQSEYGDGVSVSGVWKMYPYAPSYMMNSLQNDYFFLAKFNDNLIEREDTKFYSITTVVDSVLPSHHFFISSNGISKDDSTSLIYITGITHYTSKPAGNFFTPSSKPDIPNIRSFFQDRINSATSNRNPVAPNIPNVYGTSSYDTNAYQSQPYNLPSSNNNNSNSSGGTLPQTVLSGENFFIAMTVNDSGITTVKPFTDDADATSTPQFEYITSAGRNLHYLYSRTEKKEKQVIFDLTVDTNGNMHKKPVVNNPKHLLTLTEGIKVSPNCIIFPYYRNQSLSLAKMELE